MPLLTALSTQKHHGFCPPQPLLPNSPIQCFFFSRTQDSTHGKRSDTIMIRKQKSIKNEIQTGNSLNHKSQSSLKTNYPTLIVVFHSSFMQMLDDWILCFTTLHSCTLKTLKIYLKYDIWSHNSLTAQWWKIILLRQTDRQVTSVNLARIALSFCIWSLRASFCFGVSWGSFNFPCFLRFSSNSLRSCNSSSCSLYEYALLSRFIFFTFSSFSLSFLHSAKQWCYVYNTY